MHRYNADTSGLVRADYLYKMEQVYESEIARMDDAIANGASREVAQATKRKEKLVKQLKECKDYDDRLGHIALARIPIDLDDGVKVNYDKVQNRRRRQEAGNSGEDLRETMKNNNDLFYTCSLIEDVCDDDYDHVVDRLVEVYTS